MYLRCRSIYSPKRRFRSDVNVADTKLAFGLLSADVHIGVSIEKIDELYEPALLRSKSLLRARVTGRTRWVLNSYR